MLRIVIVHTPDHSAAELGNQATSIMTQYPTQSHYPAIDLTQVNPIPIPLVLYVRIGSNKCHSFDSTMN